MTRYTTTLVATITALLVAGTARADVVHLTNGRFIEGKVVEERHGAVHVEVQGGRVVLPSSSIERIDRRETPQEEYAGRARATNMNDADEVDKLAHWASGRGLGEQAQHLRALAKGLHLERRVANSWRSDEPLDWIDIFQWSRGQELSTEVQRWLVEQAAALDPDHPAVRAAWRTIESERALALQAACPVTPPVVETAKKEDDSERVAALERELAQRELEDRALRERVQQLEQQRRRTRRRRNPNPVVLPAPGPPDPRATEPQRALPLR